MKKILLVSFFVLLSLVGLYYAKISLPLICIGIIAAFIGTLAGGGGLITLPAMMVALALVLQLLVFYIICVASTLT
ncbi:hypothetical protein [Lysinibacillus fusiformis]|uniref:hypothetical protein n=1 Tax=Lysinibacillus fusiformis TaxID=28031 RepID=UPI001FCB84E3|nr:hypothetical protein [Lysinibacillus fusiformis]